MKFENLTTDHILEQPVPQEVKDYYITHGYAERKIPLNADICSEIYSILHGDGD